MQLIKTVGSLLVLVQSGIECSSFIHEIPDFSTDSLIAFNEEIAPIATAIKECHDSYEQCILQYVTARALTLLPPPLNKNLLSVLEDACGEGSESSDGLSLGFSEQDTLEDYMHLVSNFLFKSSSSLNEDKRAQVLAAVKATDFSPELYALQTISQSKACLAESKPHLIQLCELLAQPQPVPEFTVDPRKLFTLSSDLEKFEESSESFSKYHKKLLKSTAVPSSADNTNEVEDSSADEITATATTAKKHKRNKKPTNYPARVAKYREAVLESLDSTKTTLSELTEAPVLDKPEQTQVEAEVVGDEAEVVPLDSDSDDSQFDIPVESSDSHSSSSCSEEDSHSAGSGSDSEHSDASVDPSISTSNQQLIEEAEYLNDVAKEALSTEQ